jgi:hypothetical protein
MAMDVASAIITETNDKRLLKELALGLRGSRHA